MRCVGGGAHGQSQQRAGLDHRQHAAAQVHHADQMGRRARHRRGHVEHHDLAGVADVDGERAAAQHHDARPARGRPLGDGGGVDVDRGVSGQSGPPS